MICIHHFGHSSLCSHQAGADPETIRLYADGSGKCGQYRLFPHKERAKAAEIFYLKSIISNSAYYCQASRPLAMLRGCICGPFFA
jgi:hypothetical protein